MKKSSNILIWVAALILLIVAAYTYYVKNGPEGSGFVSQQNTSQSAVSGTLPDTTQSAGAQPDTTQSAGTGGNEQSDTTDGTSQDDKIMAPDFSLKDLEGNTVKLSDYRGKIVILNFWAVWCKYCKLEMPDLNDLNKELEKGDEAVILAVDVQEPADTVSKYLTSNNISLKALLDEDGTVAQTYGVSGYPTTFIINPDGSVYTYIPGQTNKETLLKVMDMIKNGEPLK